MILFLICAIGISFLCLLLMFFALPENVSWQSKLLSCGIALVSIGVLINKVVDFDALSVTNNANINVTSELSKARENPNSIMAWNELGRSYTLEGEYVHAYMAFTQSQQLDAYVGLGINEQLAVSERLKWLTGLAEARVQAQSGVIDNTANDFIQQSLEIDSNYPKSLWYGGMAAVQREDFRKGKALWEKLLAQSPPDAFKNVVQVRLDTLNQYLDEQDETTSATNWKMTFKLYISEGLQKTQTSETRIFATIRQASDAPPIIAKVFTINELSLPEVSILTLHAKDTISGMGLTQSVDWSTSNILSLIWSPKGIAIDESNVKLEFELNEENLDSIFEYTLK